VGLRAIWMTIHPSSVFSALTLLVGSSDL